MNPEKLARLQAQVRIGGKGTPRRKVKKVHKSAAGDDKKLQAALKKLQVQPIAGIEEVNFFRKDGKVLHFTAPKVTASTQSNTLVVSGSGEVKEITELVPGILSQLGPESIANLQKMANSLQQQQSAGAQHQSLGALDEDDDDDDVPELVETNL